MLYFWVFVSLNEQCMVHAYVCVKWWKILTNTFPNFNICLGIPLQNATKRGRCSVMFCKWRPIIWYKTTGSLYKVIIVLYVLHQTYELKFYNISCCYLVLTFAISRTSLFCTFNAAVSDDLDTQGTFSSAAMVIILFPGILRFQHQKGWITALALFQSSLNEYILRKLPTNS